MRFILVDRILELDPGKRITATKVLPASEELFRDHFPGFPVVPGVILTEMMAQAAGRCLDADGTHLGRAMLGKINGATFREWVKPDQEILLYATITQNRQSFATAECFAEVESKKVCSAELFFVFLSYKQFTTGYEHDPSSRIGTPLLPQDRT
jgi:3-hydroxyacyl-[acyl-carrier-protein] dehydratase